MKLNTALSIITVLFFFLGIIFFSVAIRTYQVRTNAKAEVEWSQCNNFIEPTNTPCGICTISASSETMYVWECKLACQLGEICPQETYQIVQQWNWCTNTSTENCLVTSPDYRESSRFTNSCSEMINGPSEPAPTIPNPTHTPTPIQLPSPSPTEIHVTPAPLPAHCEDVGATCQPHKQCVVFGDFESYTHTSKKFLHSALDCQGGTIDGANYCCSEEFLPSRELEPICTNDPNRCVDISVIDQKQVPFGSYQCPITGDYTSSWCCPLGEEVKIIGYDTVNGEEIPIRVCQPNTFELSSGSQSNTQENSILTLNSIIESVRKCEQVVFPSTINCGRVSVETYIDSVGESAFSTRSYSANCTDEVPTTSPTIVVSPPVISKSPTPTSITPSVEPTWTPAPTWTPVPTFTRAPTNTPTLTPTITDTPTPTFTIIPTNTPIPPTVQPPTNTPVQDLTVEGQKPGITPWVVILMPFALILLGIAL